MEEQITNLKAQSERGVNLISNLNASISESEIEELESICTDFIESFTKNSLYKALREDRIVEEWDKNELLELNEKIKAMNSEISAIRESKKSNNVTIETLESLVDRCNQEIEVFKNKSPSNSEDYNTLIELAKDELKLLEVADDEYKWYDTAYAKLSKFAEIETIDHEKHIFRVLGKYQVEIVGGGAKLINCDLFIGDLKLSDYSIGEIMAQIHERLCAMDDMQKCANQLGWRFSLSKTEPFCILTQNDGSPPAIVALIGDNVHPLIEWGDVSVFDFNNEKGTMETKFRKFGRQQQEE